MRTTIILCALACALFAGAASAQNLSLRGPAWAQPMLATDVTPTTGGRAALNEAGVDVAARLTVAPNQGGVARVIRYEQGGQSASLALRRFTGHPSTGWWLWGSDAPHVTPQPAAVQQEIAQLVRAAMGVGANAGFDPNQTCAAGEQAFIELAQETRSTTVTRTCISGADPVSRLARRLSELAGSRDEEELNAAAHAELLEADRAFSALAYAEGPAAAFSRYASESAITFRDGQPVRGRDEAVANFREWPEGQRLQWTPDTSRVSARGDMGWTWGRALYTRPNGSQTRLCYVTIWTRDYDGNWRVAFDSALASTCNGALPN